jgi:plasmid replication initiation protein
MPVTAMEGDLAAGDTSVGFGPSWLNEWKEITDERGRSLGLEFIIPDWLYDGIVNQRLVLTIDPAYFDLTSGIERWLYRVVRKHGGRQKTGWSFTFRQLHEKSGSLTSRAFRKFV